MKAIKKLEKIKNCLIPTKATLDFMIDEVIVELEELENKFKREQENNLSSEIAKTETILGLKKYIEALENRSCNNCKYVLENSNDTDVWLECRCKDSPMNYNSVITDIVGYLNTNFYCNRWESK